MNSSSRARAVAPFALSALLVACSAPPRALPGPVNFPRSPAPASLSIGNNASPSRPTETVITDLPASQLAEPTRSTETPSVTPANAGDEVSMAIEQTPLPMFIQILFGNVLKVPYSMDQTINARTDIVTFKTSQPISRAKMQEVAVNLLRSYQLAVLDLGGVFRIVPESAQAGSAPPILRRGKTLPDTPESLRQAFQHVEVDVVKASDISQWLRQILGTRVNVVDDAARNGFLLSGTQADLRLALELIKTLDQPRMRGRVAKRITPAFMNPLELSARLNDVLTAQGYGVAVGQLTSVPILIIPVNAIGSIIVFTTNDEVMDQVLRWARELDRPLSVQTQNGIYTYAVKYADAQELAKTLGEILTGSVGNPSAAPLATAGQGIGGVTAAPARTSGSNNRVVVNSPTNTLIIRGTTPEEYQQIMALLRELDRPVKSAMIEVVVAELRLGGSQALGIEWNINPQTSSRGSIQGGTLGRLGIGSGGLTLGFANSAGQIVGILNTLASNSQARILSNPKVMA
ncbi:MAG: secretin N-terminal domain-containing protein, partial [Ideonella sp.]